MIVNDVRIYLIGMFFVLLPADIGAGLSNPPTDSRTTMVSHGLALPFGFNLPEPAPLVTYHIDHTKVFPNPKSFERTADIMSKGQLPKNRLISFVWLHNPKVNLQFLERLADAYIREAAEEGVNYDIAFVQMCLETGFLKFSGDVKPHQNNFCGLGATGNGVPGMSFATLEEGVRAHIQHLKAYASNEPLKNPPVASRIGMVKRGKAQNFHQLTGRWATDPSYGKKIDLLLTRIYEGISPEPVRKKTSILFN